MTTANNQITLRDVRELDASTDLSVCLPQTKEADGGKITYHRLPIRCRPPIAPEAGNIAKTPAGLKRFALKFTDRWVTSIRAFGETPGELAADTPSSDQQKVTMSIALSDGRNGPTEDEENIISRLDDTTNFLRRQMVLNAEIRSTLNVAGGGKKEINEDNADMYADTLDTVNISKPLNGTADVDAETGRHPTRYIYPKVTLNGYFRTLFFAPNEKPIPVSVARSWGSGCQAPVIVVELESVFCNKLIKSVNMRVLEAVLTPPDISLRNRVRTSLIFPDAPCEEPLNDTVCDEAAALIPAINSPSRSQEAVEDSQSVGTPDTSVNEQPKRKRQRAE